MGATSHTTSSRRWPPTAGPEGIELPIGAVLAISVGMMLVTHLAWNFAVGRPFSVVGWQWDPSMTAVARQEIATSAIELLLWFAILTLLGWGRAGGLVMGWASAWGVVPLALFWAATLTAAGLTDVIEKGGGFIALAVVGVFLSALREEVAFRGFLYHGLTRTLGGTAGVLTGSALFALAHLPVEIWGRSHTAGVIVGVLLGHFCFGVLMCRIRAATGAVWFPAGVHALWNVTTIGIGFWSFPEVGDAPQAFLLLTLGVEVTGLFLAFGLLLRPHWGAFRTNTRIVMQLQAAERGQPTTPSRMSGSDAPSDGTGPRAVVPSAAPVFERFTPAARLAIVLAQEEAHLRQEPAIGSEHLLLGLLADRDGIPAKALERSGLALRPSSEPAERLLDEQDAAPSARIPFTPRTKLAIAVAIQEADRLGNDDIGPEHLLLGVVADRRAEGARVLRHLGVRPDRVRGAVLELLPAPAGSVGGPATDPHPELDPRPQSNPPPRDQPHPPAG